MRDSKASSVEILPLSDRSCCETAAEGTPMFVRRRNEPAALCGIGPSASEVVGAFERVLASGTSEVLLIWPQSPEGVAVFHTLAALDRMADCDRAGLATLFFPWSRSTGATQRTLLIDRNHIYDATLPALNRILSESPQNTAFGYLMALHSLRHLLSSGKKNSRLKRALEEDPGLMHPTLFEIMPQCGIQNAGLHTYEDQFLRRLRRHTWIAERKEHIEAAADPLRTPFFLFGVHPDAVRIKLWRAAGLDPRHGGRRPDAVLIDLTRRARNRLGKASRQTLSRFLGMVGDLYGNECPPVLAISDDVFAVQTLKWELIKDYDARRGAEGHHKRPVKTQVVLSPKPDPLDQETIVAGAPPEITAEAYGTDVLAAVDNGLKLRRLLIDAGDSENADAVTAAVDVLQNLVSLPGPARDFLEFLADNYEGYERQSRGARFDHLTPRGKIRSALQQGLAGRHHHHLAQFLAAFDKLCRTTATDNPGRKLFDECIRSLARKVTRSIVVFSNQLLRGFAEWHIESDPALADVRQSLGRKLLLVDRREAIEELELSRQEQKLFQRIVFIEPHAEDLLHVLTRSWLPEKVFVLANLARAEQTLRRIRILLELDGIGPVRERLLAVQKEFERVMGGRTIDLPDLDAAPPLPRLGALDLTAASAPGAGALRIIETSGDLRIRAFDRSEVALYDPEALQVFSLTLAKDLQPGQQICVFSPEFVGMAREKLKLTANASDVLALYHKAVAEAAKALPGTDMTSKTTALWERMHGIDPSLSLPGVAAMRHWIDVDDLIDAPRNEVRPQAPRDRRHYLCFMKALGISEDVARHYWDWGIFWTRSMRIRTGAAFHQVFMGILIDPHGTASRLPETRRHEVWRIYETAEHHVVTVLSNEQEASR
jgi:hypothetical protein